MTFKKIKHVLENWESFSVGTRIILNGKVGTVTNVERGYRDIEFDDGSIRKTVSPKYLKIYSGNGRIGKTINSDDEYHTLLRIYRNPDTPEDVRKEAGSYLSGLKTAGGINILRKNIIPFLDRNKQYDKKED